MAVTRTGTYTHITDSTQASSQSVTIPADAEILVVLFDGYSGTSNWFGGSTPFSLDGHTLIEAITWDENIDCNHTSIHYILNPSTGTQTFAWSLPAYSAYGPHFILVCYKGINTANPIKDIDSTYDTGTGQDLSVTGLTTASGDMTVGICGTDTLGSADTNGQTLIIDAAAYNGQSACAGEKSNSSSFAGIDLDYGSICAVVLAAAAAGGGSTSAPQMMHLARLRRK